MSGREDITEDAFEEKEELNENSTVARGEERGELIDEPRL